MTTSPPSSGKTQTAWTMIQAAQVSNDKQRSECIAYLLETYSPVIKAILYKAGVNNLHQIDDLAQDFAKQFIEKDLLDKLDPNKGKFRAFLSTCLRNFVKDHYRKVTKQPDVVSLQSATSEPEDQQEAVLDTYNKEWARTVMKKSLEQFFHHCEKDALPHYRQVFERHVLDPATHGFPKQKDTAELLNKSVKDIENISRRSQRLFRDKVRNVIRETVEHESDIEEELSTLRMYFGGTK